MNEWNLSDPNSRAWPGYGQNEDYESVNVVYEILYKDVTIGTGAYICKYLIEQFLLTNQFRITYI